VANLLVDDRARRVRFLQVAAGGFLKLGRVKFLRPVEAITKVDDHAVHVDQTRDHVANGPLYNPTLTNAPTVADMYRHYGYGPSQGIGLAG
jgi:hypothetical protein